MKNKALLFVLLMSVLGINASPAMAMEPQKYHDIIERYGNNLHEFLKIKGLDDFDLTLRQNGIKEMRHLARLNDKGDVLGMGIIPHQTILAILTSAAEVKKALAKREELDAIERAEAQKLSMEQAARQSEKQREELLKKEEEAKQEIAASEKRLMDLAKQRQADEQASELLQKRDQETHEQRLRTLQREQEVAAKNKLLDEKQHEIWQAGEMARREREVLQQQRQAEENIRLNELKAIEDQRQADRRFQERQKQTAANERRDAEQAEESRRFADEQRGGQQTQAEARHLKQMVQKQEFEDFLAECGMSRYHGNIRKQGYWGMEGLLSIQGDGPLINFGIASGFERSVFLRQIGKRRNKGPNPNQERAQFIRSATDDDYQAFLSQHGLLQHYAGLVRNGVRNFQILLWVEEGDLLSSGLSRLEISTLLRAIYKFNNGTSEAMEEADVDMPQRRPDFRGGLQAAAAQAARVQPCREDCGLIKSVLRQDGSEHLYNVAISVVSSWEEFYKITSAEEFVRRGIPLDQASAIASANAKFVRSIEEMVAQRNQANALPKKLSDGDVAKIFDLLDRHELGDRYHTLPLENVTSYEMFLQVINAQALINVGFSQAEALKIMDSVKFGPL